MVWLDDGGAKQTKKIATIVLLYDEMNANVSHGIVDVLASNGMKVGTKMVLPVHSATAQVVPAIFSGRSFKIANACGYTRVCSEEAVLDFSQITVNRGDVDVIGFYLPYCEILGLRSCERVVVKRSVFDIKHWRCAVENFLNNTEYGKNNFCQKLHHEAFAEMREKVIGALLDAPALQRGGGVFAHLPLPHPPANMTGTLSEQYKSNVSKAELVLTQVLNKLNENKIEPRILIFSDHPLRPAMWCARESDQFDAPCVVPAELLDDHVPFIVAARSNVPSIAHVQSNQQVFDVLREWLKH
jgi:hypothetical protein